MLEMNLVINRLVDLVHELVDLDPFGVELLKDRCLNLLH